MVADAEEKVKSNFKLKSKFPLRFSKLLTFVAGYFKYAIYLIIHDIWNRVAGVLNVIKHQKKFVVFCNAFIGLKNQLFHFEILIPLVIFKIVNICRWTF